MIPLGIYYLTISPFSSSALSIGLWKPLKFKFFGTSNFVPNCVTVSIIYCQYFLVISFAKDKNPETFTQIPSCVSVEYLLFWTHIALLPLRPWRDHQSYVYSVFYIKWVRTLISTSCFLSHELRFKSLQIFWSQLFFP